MVPPVTDDKTLTLQISVAIEHRLCGFLSSLNKISYQRLSDTLSLGASPVVAATRRVGKE
jgi:hypothetical protein